MEMARKVWFITGASKGFGMELTKAALDALKQFGQSMFWSIMPGVVLSVRLRR
jgi:hypothetical protein